MFVAKVKKWACVGGGGGRGRMVKKNRLGLIFSSYWGAGLVYVEIKEAKG
jgi:hypothetical protein